MKNLILLFFVILIVAFGFKVDNNFILKNHVNNFKHKNLSKFIVDESTWSSRKTYYSLDSSLISTVWQGKQGYNKFYDSTYFYSIQNNPRGLQEITILQELDEAGCFALYYLIYNQNGVLISFFDLASDCAEGGITYKSKGQFLNDSIYEQKIYEEHMYDIDTLKETRKGDSTLLKIKIQKTGLIKEESRQTWNYIRTLYFKNK
jgi:hypothetical protein